MVLISVGILVLMWILGHDFSGHYNRLALISVDIISGVYCTFVSIKYWNPLNFAAQKTSINKLKMPARGELYVSSDVCN